MKMDYKNIQFRDELGSGEIVILEDSLIDEPIKHNISSNDEFNRSWL